MFEIVRRSPAQNGSLPFFCDFGARLICKLDKTGYGELLPRILHIDQIMANTGAFFFCGFRRTDIQPPIHLNGIGVDDGKSAGIERRDQLRLPDPGGAEKEDYLGKRITVGLTAYRRFHHSELW